MATMATMASAFLGGSAATLITKQPSTATTSRRGTVVMANASKVAGVDHMDEKKETGGNNGRREMMFSVAAAAAAAFSVAGVALADDDEPKRGTEAAKKKYAPVCITMPTARICRN